METVLWVGLWVAAMLTCAGCGYGLGRHRRKPQAFQDGKVYGYALAAQDLRVQRVTSMRNEGRWPAANRVARHRAPENVEC